MTTLTTQTDTPLHEPARSFDFGKLYGKLPGAQLDVVIDCVPDTQVIPGAYVLRRGTNRVRIFVADLPVVQAMVRTDADNADYAAAVTKHERRLAAAIAKACDGIDAEDDLARERKKTIDTYWGSPEAVFQEEHDRPLPPLRSCEVLSAEPLPAPVDPVADARDKASAVAMAQAIAAALTTTIAPTVANAVAAAVASALGRDAKR